MINSVVSYKPDWLLGWSITAILLILGSIYAEIEYNFSVHLDILITDIDTGVVGVTFFIDIIHYIHMKIKEHRIKKDFLKYV